MDFLQVYRSVRTQNLTALLGRFKKRWRTCARNRWRATCNIQECLRMHTWRIQVQFGNTRRPNLNRIFQMYIESKSWFRLFGMCWSLLGECSCSRLQVRALVGDVVSCAWFLGKTLLSQLALSTVLSNQLYTKRNRHILCYFILESVAQGFVKIHLSQGGLKSLLEKNPSWFRH